MKQEQTFWADQLASEIDRAGKSAVVATGITPSGEIHIGNMREVVTGDVLVRALRGLGHSPRFIYIADTFDPLRRVYPFLDPKKYQPHVGKPLSEIPCPCDQHDSYAEHYLEPFLQSLTALDIPAEIVRADRLYKEQGYAKNIVRALESIDKIRAILKQETGRDTSSDWAPFQAICPECGRMTGTKVTGLTDDKTRVRYICECGSAGEVPVAGGGKLSWRIDWPARWEVLGVTTEPFGKDHASKGGSYDTGVRIAREVFNYEPPFPVVYEWIGMRGGGDMSSSKGNVIAIHNMLEVAPPDVLKYFVVKARPGKRIVFDPGLPLLALMDEYDDPSSNQRNHRAAELAKVQGHSPVGAPFRHMVSLVQTTQDDVEKVTAILKRNGYKVTSDAALAGRVKYARRWLEEFAPDDVRFDVQSTVPEMTSALSVEQRDALGRIAERLIPNMNAEEIHLLIYAVKDETGLSPGKIFEAIYRSILGKERGPRAGFFLASLDTDFVKRRFQEVASVRA